MSINLYSQFKTNDAFMVTYKETLNGKVFKCSKCNLIHVEYKNININLSKSQFQQYADYLDTLDGAMWETQNTKAAFSRKIIIPTSDSHIRILLNKEELNELKYLFGCNECLKILKTIPEELLVATYLN
ncbi:DUF6686 family protein [Saccharicrinis aurantiacus]|uniref:DUF6686 family protein n=1 Tax=Saccharicrinis aurantiacus TaxID=1849719 RepID=UPI00095021D2|nr:DUF6686 family protein [Saccharicrinis aurantiacus]